MRFLLFNSAFIIWFFSLLTHLSSVLTPPRTFIIGGHEVQLYWFWDTVTRIFDKTLTVSSAQVDRMLELVIMYALILLPVMFISAYLPRLFKNRKTKDYGSAAWATKSELRRNGLIGRYGIIFGQCHEARYKEVFVHIVARDKLTVIEPGTIIKEHLDAVHNQSLAVAVYGMA